MSQRGWKRRGEGLGSGEVRHRRWIEWRECSWGGGRGPWSVVVGCVSSIL